MKSYDSDYWDVDARSLQMELDAEYAGMVILGGLPDGSDPDLVAVETGAARRANFPAQNLLLEAIL